MKSNLESPRVITVTVKGGNIQDIDGIPSGVTVRVLDYDGDEDKDDDGTPCAISHHGPSPGLIAAAPELLAMLIRAHRCLSQKFGAVNAGTGSEMDTFLRDLSKAIKNATGGAQ